VRRASLLRFALAFALSASVGLAGQEKRGPDCCSANTTKLSPRQLKSLLWKTEMIQPPPLANQLRLSGTVVLAIAVDARGIVTCLQRVTGHPLIIGSVIDSVSRWKFRPYIVQGRPTSFCGRVALQFQANERTVKYRVVEAPPG
jgi:outer membrane biosynthesis protein TonB